MAMMKSPSRASLAMRSEAYPLYQECSILILFSIRLTFSIADIQSEDEEDYQNAETEGQGEESGSEDEPLHSYPIRASLSITKARPDRFIACYRR
jgi:hypothetical protein